MRTLFENNMDMVQPDMLSGERQKVADFMELKNADVMGNYEYWYAYDLLMEDGSHEYVLFGIDNYWDDIITDDEIKWEYNLDILEVDEEYLEEYDEHILTFSDRITLGKLPKDDREIEKESESIAFNDIYDFPVHFIDELKTKMRKHLGLANS